MHYIPLWNLVHVGAFVQAHKSSAKFLMNSVMVALSWRHSNADCSGACLCPCSDPR